MSDKHNGGGAVGEMLGQDRTIAPPDLTESEAHARMEKAVRVGVQAAQRLYDAEHAVTAASKEVADATAALQAAKHVEYEAYMQWRDTLLRRPASRPDPRPTTWPQPRGREFL